MVPTFEDGQILILNKMDREYERMDVVVFDYKKDRLIKRVIGLPGETVEIKDNILYINGEEVSDYKDDVKTADYELNVVIPEGYYFVLGDNRGISADSRMIGLISEDDLKGTVCFRLFPLMKIGGIK
jgi:signal peptidase I